MKWIKCSEQMPDPYVSVLIYCKWSGNVFTSYLFDVNKQKRSAARKHKDKYPVDLQWYVSFYGDYFISHWMPEPEAPKD